MNLDNNIVAVYYKNWVFRGKDTNLTMLDMISRGGFSYQLVGDIFNVSKQTVSNRMMKIKELEPDLWDLAENRKLFYEEIIKVYNESHSIMEVAEVFEISFTMADKLVRELIPDWKKHRLLERRLDYLAEFVFGPKYTAGEDFTNYIMPFINKLSPDAKNRLKKYIKTEDDPHSVERSYRKKDIGKLIDLILNEEVSIPDLLQKGVICRRKI